MNIASVITKSPFLTSVTVLATGTAIAQAIRFFASPVLTRLYTPEAFGLFATFMAFVVSLMPGITGKYEAALVLPKQSNKAAHLFAVAMWFSLFVFFLFELLLLVFETSLLQKFDAMSLRGWIFLAPVVLLLGGLFNLGQYWAVRQDRYVIIARSKVMMALATVIINIVLGLLDVGFAGLLLGNLIGFLVAVIYLYSGNVDFALKVFRGPARRRLVMAKRYADFPVYNASSGILDGVTISLPVFFLTYYYSLETVGFYALVMNVLIMPKRFLASSVSQVNLKKIVSLVNAGERVEPYIYRLSAGMFALSLPPCIILLIWGPELFSFIFGVAWIEAGRFAQILAIPLAIKLVSSTLSSSLGATNNNRLGAVWKVLAFITTLLVLVIFSGEVEVYRLLMALVISDTVLYVLYYFLIIKAIKNPKN